MCKTLCAEVLIKGNKKNNLIIIIIIKIKIEINNNNKPQRFLAQEEIHVYFSDIKR